MRCKIGLQIGVSNPKFLAINSADQNLYGRMKFVIQGNWPRKHGQTSAEKKIYLVILGPMILPLQWPETSMLRIPLD